MASVITKSDILTLQANIDAYRSKFKHQSTTPFTWNYNGNRDQGWTNQTISGGYAVPRGAMLSPNIHSYTTGGSTFSVDESVYRFFSISLSKEANVTLSVINTSDAVIATVYPVKKTNFVYVYEFTAGTSWQNVKQLKVETDANIKYIKLDKISPFADTSTRSLTTAMGTILTEQGKTFVNVPVSSSAQSTVTVPDFGIQTNKPILNSLIEWVDTNIKNNQSKAFNGCATCDVYTGGTTTPVTCSPNMTCTSYAACTCNGTTYTITPATCTCNNTKYGNSSVTTTTLKTAYFYATAGYTWREGYDSTKAGWRVNQGTSYHVKNGKYELYHGSYNTSSSDDVKALNSGYIFFDYADIRSKLQDYEIKSAALRLTRTDSSHGYNPSMNISIGLHNNSESVYPDSTPAILASPGVYKVDDSTFEQGQTKTVPIKTSFVEAIQNKTAKGIVLHTSSYDNERYAYFEPGTKNMCNPLPSGYSSTYKYVPDQDQVPRLKVEYYEKVTTETGCSCYNTKYGYNAGTSCNSGYGATPCSQCYTACNAYSCSCNATSYGSSCRDCHNTSYHV